MGVDTILPGVTQVSGALTKKRMWASREGGEDGLPGQNEL